MYIDIEELREVYEITVLPDGDLQLTNLLYPQHTSIVIPSNVNDSVSVRIAIYRMKEDKVFTTQYELSKQTQILSDIEQRVDEMQEVLPGRLCDDNWI